jgi:lycopene cyclase domain-containing protein
MTYFKILLVFIAPPLVALAVFVPRDLWGWAFRRGSRPDLRPYWIILAHVGMALVYTTPWDNYLVATGVWWYDPALVTGIRLGYVPVEEYTFFVVQTLLTGLWVLGLLRFLAKTPPRLAASPRLRWISSLSVIVVWLFSTLVWFSGWKPGAYLTLIISWALVPVLIQVAFGADILLAHWLVILPGVFVPTLYLWVVDHLALGSGTWAIDPAQTTGLRLGILPLEEMVFFFMTNLIIVFGVTLMLAESSQVRARKLLADFRIWWIDKGFSQG